MLPQKFYSTLEAVIYVALNAKANAISGKEICESQGVNPRYLEKIMQILVHNSILKGTKGPKGGYNLAREKRKITAGDIYRAYLEYESEGNKVQYTKLAQKTIKPLGDEIQKKVMLLLDGVTIEDIVKKSNSQMLQPGDEVKDFFI